MKIVIDTLGSDNKLNDILDGVIDVINEVKDYDVALVGDESYITNYLNGKTDLNRIEIINAIKEVDDSTNPMGMLRDLDDTALVKALKRTKESDSIGLITCSNTGCVLVGSIMHVGLVSKKLLTPVLCCLIKDINLKDIKLQKEEINYVSYMNVEEIKEAINKGLINKAHEKVFEKVLEYNNL